LMTRSSLQSCTDGIGVVCSIGCTIAGGVEERSKEPLRFELVTSENHGCWNRGAVVALYWEARVVEVVVVAGAANGA
jgi:hypothetical protein